MSYFDYEKTLLSYFQNMRMELLSRPLNLGGVAGSGGGAGGPVGGFTGYLPQTRISYDLSEISSSTTPVSGSLLDNLNHIRYRIDQVAASGIGGITVLDDGVSKGTNITSINFSGNSTVTVVGNAATVAISGGGTSSVTNLDSLTDTIITSPMQNDTLQYDGTNWVNRSTATFTNGVIFGGYPDNFTIINFAGVLAIFGNQVKWDKVSFPMSSAKSGVSSPTWVNVSGVFYGYQFATGNDIVLTIDLPANDSALGQYTSHDIYPFVSWVTTAQDASTRYVKFETTYTIALLEIDYPGEYGLFGLYNSGTISTETAIPANTLSNTIFRTDIGTIPATSYNEGSVVMMNIKRIAASGTAPSSDPVGLVYGYYHRVNSLGVGRRY